MPKIAGVMIWDIFGLYSGYMLVNYEISKHHIFAVGPREVIALLQRPEFNPAEMLAGRQ